jgi:hypothetical protein
MVKNGLHAIALNQRLALGPSLWSRQGLAQLQALVLLPHTRRRRDDSLELLHWLNCHSDALDLHVAPLQPPIPMPAAHDASRRPVLDRSRDRAGARPGGALPRQ